MEMDLVIDGSREALRMALLLGGPLLAVALAVGLVVGVVQTLTQMSEPVVGQVARLAAVLLFLSLLVVRARVRPVLPLPSPSSRFSLPPLSPPPT